jgi:DNA-binding NtrC family response regulator
MPRILIVDDAANLRLLYRLELEAEGYEIIAVESGTKALEVLANEKIDAIVLDLLLPDCFGLELLGEILAWQRHVPLVINTAYEQFRDNFQTWGAEAFIVKSSDLSELKWVLKQIISGRIQGGAKNSRRENKLQSPHEKKASTLKSLSSSPAALVQ